MSFVQNVSEGGQTWAHRIRMLRQVFKIATWTAISFGIAIFIISVISIPVFYYEATWYYFKALVLEGYTSDMGVNAHFWQKLAHESGRNVEISVSIKKVIYLTGPHVRKFYKEILINLYVSGVASAASWIFLMSFFFFKGRLSKGKKHLSGNKFSPFWLVKAKLILLNRASPIRVGPLPLVKGTETQHLLITGGTGSGKSNCINHLLEKIRENNQKAVIVDTSGSFIKRFYREGQDIILNPFDKRGHGWHPWVECTNNFDYDAIAESFIPQSFLESENYWRQAARTLFSSLLQKLESSKVNSDITKWILYESLSQLCSFVAGTKAASHMDINSEKTSSSIRSVTSSFLSSFEYLEDSGDPFSIREWVRDEANTSWLFLHCQPSQRAAINPLLSTWISVAIRNLIQLEPKLERRLWFFLDELASLPKIKDLEALLTEGRKYGGCGVLALQSLAQLDGIYGKASSSTIIGNCSTKLVFSEQDPEIAQRISRSFGEKEVKEFHEGISYGAHEVRDGVSLSSQNKSMPVVSATDIQTLKKNIAFARLPGHYPITKVKFSLFKGI